MQSEMRKYFIYFFAVVFALLTLTQCSIAQKKSQSNSKKAFFKNLVDSANFVFDAQSVMPLRGHYRNLTSPYDVTVTKDTLRSYLPYFGRAFSAVYNETNSVLDFRSTNFSYTVSAHKKNGWDIVIVPKDNVAIQRYFFTVYDNGSATLNVTCTSRDAISFNGIVEKRKNK
jgi:hypothetical protein